MVKVYNRHHKNYPLEAVYIGRGTLYGNPYDLETYGSREKVMRLYIQYIEDNPELKERIINDLKGKNLLCSCKPLACHGDYLLKICNSDINSEENLF